LKKIATGGVLEVMKKIFWASLAMTAFLGITTGPSHAAPAYHLTTVSWVVATRNDLDKDDQYVTLIGHVTGRDGDEDYFFTDGTGTVRLDSEKFELPIGPRLEIGGRIDQAYLGIGHLETTDDGLFSYEEVECLAACDRAPCMQINLRFKYDLTPAMVDDMLAAMRAGTFDVKPMPQTQMPGRTWKVAQDTGRKSAGGVGVSNPNNAGGVGDRSGIIMLDRVVNDPQFAARSRERLVHEPHLRPSTGEGGHH